MEIVGIVKLKEINEKIDRIQYFAPVYFDYDTSKYYTRHPSSSGHKLFKYNEVKSSILRLDELKKEILFIQKDKDKLNFCDINSILLPNDILIIGNKEYIEYVCNYIMNKDPNIKINIGLIKFNLTDINYRDYIGTC